MVRKSYFKTIYPWMASPSHLLFQYGFGVANDYYELHIYRPTLIKEVMMDGKIIDYLDGDEKLRLPYIFKGRVQLNDFSTKGYQAYECKKPGQHLQKGTHQYRAQSKRGNGSPCCMGGRQELCRKTA